MARRISVKVQKTGIRTFELSVLHGAAADALTSPLD